MKLKAGLLAFAIAATSGPTLLLATQAFAYTTMADCEAGEGAGKCCAYGSGANTSYHVCGALPVSGAVSKQAMVKLLADENAKTVGKAKLANKASIPVGAARTGSVMP